MPGSRLAGLPAHLLGSGDGHRCARIPRPRRSLEGSCLRFCAVRRRRQRRSSSSSAAGAPRGPRLLTGGRLQAGSPASQKARPAAGDGLPCEEASLTKALCSEMPFPGGLKATRGRGATSTFPVQQASPRGDARCSEGKKPEFEVSSPAS